MIFREFQASKLWGTFVELSRNRGPKKPTKNKSSENVDIPAYSVFETVLKTPKVIQKYVFQPKNRKNDDFLVPGRIWQDGGRIRVQNILFRKNTRSRCSDGVRGSFATYFPQEGAIPSRRIIEGITRKRLVPSGANSMFFPYMTFS